MGALTRSTPECTPVPSLPVVACTGVVALPATMEVFLVDFCSLTARSTITGLAARFAERGSASGKSSSCRFPGIRDREGETNVVCVECGIPTKVGKCAVTTHARVSSRKPNSTTSAHPIRRIISDSRRYRNYQGGIKQTVLGCFMF